MSIVVLTYATHDQGYFECLKQSCEKWGYDLRVLGWRQQWKGYGSKLQAALKALKGLPEHQLTMFVDAFDVFMCGPADEVADAYEIAGSPTLLVGASRGLVGAEQMQRSRYDEWLTKPTRCSDSPYTLLCSGTYLCKAGDGARLIDSLSFSEVTDDQSLMVALRSKHGDDVVRLDCTFQVFATLMPSTFGGEVRTDDRIKIVPRDNIGASPHTERAGESKYALRLHSGVTNSFPLVVHGPANANLSPLLQQLGYEKHGVGTPFLYKVKKIAYHTQELAQQNMIIVAIASSLLLLLIVAIVSAVRHARSSRPTLKQDASIATAAVKTKKMLVANAYNG